MPTHLHQVSIELAVLRLLRCEPLGAEAAEASTGKAAAAAAAAAVELACCRGEGAPQWGALLARHCAPMGDQPGGLVPEQAQASTLTLCHRDFGEHLCKLMRMHV